MIPSKVHAEAIAALQIKHLRTMPYRPRTNGKAEACFIQALQVERAYAAGNQNHHQRAAALEPWVRSYNFRRPHSALGHKLPASRIQPN